MTSYFFACFLEFFSSLTFRMASCKHQLNGKTSTTELLRRLEVAPSCSSERKDNSTRLEPDIALIHDKYVLRLWQLGYEVAI